MEPNNRFGVKFSTARVQFAQFEARDFQLSEPNIRALQLLAVKTHFLVLVQISPNAFAKWFAPENVCRSSERQTANTRQWYSFSLGLKISFSTTDQSATR